MFELPENVFYHVLKSRLRGSLEVQEKITPSVANCIIARSDFLIEFDLNSKFRLNQAVFCPHIAAILQSKIEFKNLPDRINLSTGGKRILNTPNAGGNSVWSEVMSFEVIHSLTGANLEKTEMEIEYFPCGGKITDYSINIQGKVFGISVTRALKFRGEFTIEDGIALLTKKLSGVNDSTRLVLDSHRWTKQILHIIAQFDYIANVLILAYDHLSDELKSNTVILITISNADWLY